MAQQWQEQGSSGSTDQLHAIPATPLLPAVTSRYQVRTRARRPSVIVSLDRSAAFSLLCFQELDIEAPAVSADKAMHTGAAAGLPVSRINQSDGSRASS